MQYIWVAAECASVTIDLFDGKLFAFSRKGQWQERYLSVTRVSVYTVGWTTTNITEHPRGVTGLCREWFSLRSVTPSTTPLHTAVSLKSLAQCRWQRLLDWAFQLERLPPGERADNYTTTREKHCMWKSSWDWRGIKGKGIYEAMIDMSCSKFQWSSLTGLP